MDLLKKMFGHSKDKIWEQLQSEWHAHVIQKTSAGRDQIVAKVDEWTVTLDMHALPTQYDTVPYLRMRAPYINKDGFRFTIYDGGIFDSIGKLFGLQDIVVGYPEMDARYIIQGNNDEKVKQLCSNPALRQLIQLQTTIFFQVKSDEGYFHDQFPDGVDELNFLGEDVEGDAERLKALFELFSVTLHQLCHIGSAYESDPHITLD